MLFLKFVFAVSRAECNDNAPLPGARWRWEGLRAGAQVPWAGANAIPRQEALQRGNPFGSELSGEPLPEGAAGGGRSGAQSHEVDDFLLDFFNDLASVIILFYFFKNNLENLLIN